MTPADSEYVARVCASFAQQRAMAYLGAVGGGFAWARRDRLAVSRGADAAAWLRPRRHHHGDCRFRLWLRGLHAGAAGCRGAHRRVQGKSAQSRGRGAFVARGQVVKPGRTLTVCTGEVVAERADGAVRSVALMQATMMTIRERETIAG